MRYKNVGIPKPLADRFDIISRYYGYGAEGCGGHTTEASPEVSPHLALRSFSEFVVGLVRSGVALLETKHDMVVFEQKRKDEHE